MRRKRPCAEFRMKLRAEEKRVHILRKFGDFHEYPIRRLAGKNKSGLFQLFNVLRIYLVAMPVALGNDAFSISRPIAV